MNKELENVNLILANPRGFCAGVERAVDIVNRALTLFDEPIYVKHEVVHNKYVIQDMKKRGVTFIEDIDDVPKGSILIFSAHGVSIDIKNKAEEKKLKIFDATCPLVTKVHMEVHKYASENRDVILIGHKGHPEIEGTMGQYISHTGTIYLVENENQIDNITTKNKKIAYVTQTTLSVDDTKKIINKIKKRFPKIIGPSKDDICYATQNRQDAVKEILKSCDCLIVVGSKNSSNSRRLTELAEKRNIPTYLVDNKYDLEINKIKRMNTIGITAGASAPEILINEILQYLEDFGASITNSNTKLIQENITFTLPKELR
ncbi:MAG: 4-hydroxy-3-methylbut-2-enyl diphosphate reductase [Gammaproteobacteria bacterium]|nr:4-hydroxy-3-methylbut-2-enyl diphosphate reductase [Gammaproteobacteria bacterium]|tara:strand:+ start:57769 stop:58719 length:951 start_codon:yes stop_codon:yes gene_type:complete